VQEHQRTRERGDREHDYELKRHGSHRVRILAAPLAEPQQALTSAAVRLAPPLADPVHARVGGVADPARLVVVSCASLPDAERALDELRGLGVGVRDAAVVARTRSGRLELRQTHQVAAGEGVVAGGTVGFLAGMLLGGPVGAALLGMLGGGIWASRDTGVPDARLRELGDSLTPGRALLCVLVAPDDAPAARAALASYGEVADADASGAP
jgi:uncharacterized membrane protein